MYPLIREFGTYKLPLLGEVELSLPTYGVIFALSVMIAWWWFQRRGRQLGVPEERLFNACFYSLLAGILGAKLLLVLVDWRAYLAHPRELLGTLRTGGVLLGGVIAGVLTFTIYVRRHGLPLLKLGDAAAAPLALAQSIGRLGCFCAGCCWGVAASPDNPLAVTFTSLKAHEQTGVPLFSPRVPVQLIQMVHDLVLALVLAVLWHKRPRPDGTVFWIYVLFYSLGRGVIEFWRGDIQRGLYLGGMVSTSQLLAMAGFAFALVMLLRGRSQRRRAASG